LQSGSPLLPTNPNPYVNLGEVAGRMPTNLTMQLWLFAGLLFAVWVPVELATAHFLRRRRGLRAAG
jgi:hypothetical protein